MDYGQIFSQVLQRPSMDETMRQAQQMAQSILAYQKEQRTAPVMQALQQYGAMYGSAQDDQARQMANSMANQTRQNFLMGGGSPMDLPQQFWGSNPGQGFQTSEGFQAPVTGFEGLKRTDAMAMRRQALMDALSRRQLEADLTGIDPQSGAKTWPRQYQEMGLAMRSAGGGGGGGGRPSQSMIDRGSYSSAIEGVANSLEQLKGAYGSQPYADKFSTEYGMLAPAQVIEQQINAQRAQLRAQGIDPDKLIDEAYKMAYQVDRDAYWKQADKRISGNDFGL